MLEDFLKYQAKTTPNPLGLEIDRANGSYIFDTQGKSYLDFIEGDSVSSKLSDEIDAQISASIESIGSLKENFVAQVNENNIEMLRTYDVIQAAVVMLKVDMLQKLNISVDYVDADGD